MRFFLRRRLSFPLVSLFDLLIIIVFAQHMDLTQQTEGQLQLARSEAAEAARRLEHIERDRNVIAHGAEIHKLLQEDFERLRESHELEKIDAARKEFELAEEARKARADLARLGELVADLFDLPEASLKDVLQSRSPAEVEKIRRELKNLAAKSTGQAIRHILTLAELQKRCDIWEIHINDDNTIRFTAGEQTVRFRAADAAKFEADVFRHYKSLPQPKSLVVILLSWGDADLGTRTAATEGLHLAATHMGEDSDRRSRFEYAILGYIPSQSP
jgi:hypothetical protein